MDRQAPDVPTTDDRARRFEEGQLRRASRIKASPYVRGQAIVKYGDSVTEDIAGVFARRGTLQDITSDQSDSLDHLHTTYHVKKATPLFRTAAKPTDVRQRDTRTVLKQRQQDWFEAVRRRFPKRATRSPQGRAPPDLSSIYRLDVGEDINIEEFCAAYQADPHVESCQPNYLVMATTMNDPYLHSEGSWGQDYEDLWGLKMIGAEQAYSLSRGAGVVVAVVDSGVDYTHPDLSPNIWVNAAEIPGNGQDDDANGYVDDIRGFDFANDDADPRDDNGHGTHVAGTIAAVGNNGQGIVGVAPQARILAVKGLDAEGSGNVFDLARAMLYATTQGADVINNSWGGPANAFSGIIEHAIQTVFATGTVVVFAAGNDNDNTAFYTAVNMTDSKPIVVASVDHLGQKSGFSNYGLTVDIAAPGGESGFFVDGCTRIESASILSLRAGLTDLFAGYPCYDAGAAVLPQGNSAGTYYRALGTSMAAPHVSGVAALLLSHWPSMTNENVRQVIRMTAHVQMGQPGFTMAMGAGRLNASGALSFDYTQLAAYDGRITFPPKGQYLSQRQGNVVVMGIAAGPVLEEYQLFYGVGSAPTEWIQINSGAIPSPNERELGQWPVGELPDGKYVLKLEVKYDLYHIAHVVPVSLLFDLPVRISANTGDDFMPRVSDDQVAWIGVPPPHQQDAFAKIKQCEFDGVNGCPETTFSGTIPLVAPHYGGRIDFSDDLVAWTWEGNRFGIGKVGVCQTALTPANCVITYTEPPHDNYDFSQPAISGSRVVWAVQYRTGQPYFPTDIYLCEYDTNTNSCPAQKIISGSSEKDSVAISGERIVWLDDRHGDHAPEVYLYDLQNPAQGEQRITYDLPGWLDRKRLRISGDFLVWLDSTSDYVSRHNMVLYNLKTRSRRQLITNSRIGEGPRMAGSHIVWEETRGEGYDIFLYDIFTQRERFVAPGGTLRNDGLNFSPLTAPDIDGNLVVFDGRRHNYDIFLVKLTPHAMFPTPRNSVFERKQQPYVFNVPVQLDMPSNEMIAIQFSVNQAMSTASRGSDYTLPWSGDTGILIYRPGVRSRNIPVTILPDTLADDSETIVFDLSDSSGNVKFVEPKRFTLTIRDPLCFLATAAFGTSLAPELKTLRAFRDQVLLSLPAGRVFVTGYYRLSPSLAQWMSHKPLLRALVRAGLRSLLEGTKSLRAAH